MLNRLIRKPLLSCSLIFIVCSLARLFEYFYMRTDETLLSENSSVAVVIIYYSNMDV